MTNKQIILYHGSENVIDFPEYGVGKTYNDYGQGFYCTEHIELAKEWACTEGSSGFANSYQLNLDGLKVLNLSDERYTILNWLAILVDNRRVRISTPGVRRSVDWIKENYLVDISKYDVIRGYRADDAYFSFVRAFVNNAISLSQLSRAMHLGALGEQYVLKTKKAFKQIEFIGSELAEQEIYYARRKERDEAARASFESELDSYDLDGIFIRDLIRE